MCQLKIELKKQERYKIKKNENKYVLSKSNFKLYKKKNKCKTEYLV